MDFEDRHVVVTGGTGQLGSAVVARLLDLGAQVHIPAVEPDVPEDFMLDSHPDVRLSLGIDLTNSAAVDRFYDGLPRLWASIHCAGGFGMGAFEEGGLDLLDQMLAMNLRTAFACSQAAVRRMTGGGRIVNVASRQAVEPRQGAGAVAYTASKAAVAAFTAALAQEVVDRGILVNAVAPSILATDTNRAAMPDAEHDAWAALDQVAEVILFLASPENAIARGGVIPVYGRT